MKKFLLAGVAVIAIAGSTIAYAQHHHQWFREHARISAEDRAAFTDARIAAVHAGLKLNPEQEKLWPPVETAVRDLVKLRTDRANARINGGFGDAKPGDSRPGDSADAPKQDLPKPADPVTRLRERADTMAASAAAMKKIADAADPLYKTLDDSQKRRLGILTRIDGRFDGGGWRHRGFERGMMDRDRDGGDRGRGYDRDRYDRDGGPGSDRGGQSGPERL